MVFYRPFYRNLHAVKQHAGHNTHWRTYNLALLHLSSRLVIKVCSRPWASDEGAV